MKLHLPLPLYRALLTVVVASASLISSQAVADLVITTNTTEPGEQIVEGSISVEGSKLDVGSNQTASTDITVANSNGDTKGVTVGGDQTATAGAISVTDSKMSVTGNQTAGTNISVITSESATENSVLTVGGDQTATSGSITTEKTKLDITGKQTAAETIDIKKSRVQAGLGVTIGKGQEAKNIKIDEATLTIQEGGQKATENITMVRMMDTTVNGDQTAETGAIDLRSGGNWSMNSHTLLTAEHTLEAINSFKGYPDVRYRIKSQERSPLFIQVGTGLNVPFSRQWSATLSGSGEFGNDRAGVNGCIGVNYSF